MNRFQKILRSGCLVLALQACTSDESRSNLTPSLSNSLVEFQATPLSIQEDELPINFHCLGNSIMAYRQAQFYSNSEAQDKLQTREAFPDIHFSENMFHALIQAQYIR